MRIGRDQVSDVFSSLLEAGDDVLIHASLGTLGYFEDGVEALVRSVANAVGPAGTVIMMADTRSFAWTGTFSVDQPSETGLMTECFRQMDGVRRSLVPMVSFCALGTRAAEYTQSYHSHLDETATLSQLLQLDGKIMLLGVGYQKCTLYHVAEERFQVDYNCYKRFSGVLLRDGRPAGAISQRYFVRRELGTKKDPSIAGRMLEESGAARVAQLGKGEVRVFGARAFDECCMAALEKDRRAFLA